MIRIATKDDAEKLLEIYSYYVENTAITFEYDVPTLLEFQNRITHTLETYPYLVLENDGEILGYAYASPFKERKAYDWAVETTIYISHNYPKKGYGKELYFALEKALALQNITNLNACIAYLDNDDKYLTKNSVQFHNHIGYNLVGTFHKCGYKFDRWYDMVWMEKFIAEHKEKPLPLIPFNETRQKLFSLYNIK